MPEMTAYQLSLPISLYCYKQLHEITHRSCLCLYGAKPLLTQTLISADF